MYKNIILLISIGIIFGLDKDWTNYEGHEISLNTIIIKIDNELAPKLGVEGPLTMEQVFGLKVLEDTGHKRFYLNDSDILRLSDAEIVVCNQWGSNNIPKFLNLCKELNIKVNQ